MWDLYLEMQKWFKIYALRSKLYKWSHNYSADKLDNLPHFSHLNFLWILWNYLFKSDAFTATLYQKIVKISILFLS